MRINIKLFIFLLLVNNPVFSEVLFEENFDNMQDWQTLGSGETGPLPPGFDYGYTEETYHPETYPESLPSISISGADTSQVYGGTGKALIATYETTDSPGIYTSDGFLSKDITPSNRVYVSFKVKFQPGFNAERANGSIKLFRILSYDGVGSRSAFFSSGNSAPIYLFDWSLSDYGVRQKHAFRCDDQASTYYCTNPNITDAPRSISNGDMSANFTNDVANLNPGLIDQVNNEVLPSSGTVWHEQVYGETWHKLAFYVALNSSPSTRDGALKFWLDDKLLIDMKEIPWIGANGSMNAKWNNVSFGGNGKYHWDTSSGYDTSKERWVAIDDIVIRDDLPVRPRSPEEVTAQ